MTLEHSFIGNIIEKNGNKAAHNAAVVSIGVVLLCLLAQVSITLPFTIVPVTGQTFGVALISLLWGKSRGVSSVAIYLALGSVGLPVFAFGKSGLSFGPTSGYLIGMLLAAYVMGALADKGWTKSFLRTWFAGFIGSAIIFLCGLMVLSFFVPAQRLLIEGLLPFLPGDFLKTLLACTVVRQTAKTATKHL